VETKLPIRSPAQAALDRGADFCKTLTWTGLLLAGALYIVSIFGPLGLFSPSGAPIWSFAASSNFLYRLLAVNGANTHHEPSARHDEKVG
jgi:hypothetical protein